MKRFFMLLFLILAISTALLFGVSMPFAAEGPKAEAGVLDYENTDFSSEVYALDGQWEFYFGSLYTPDDFRQGKPEGGNIRLMIIRNGEKAEIQVEDTGEGIAPEHLPYIFERFYKVSRERGEKDGSSGLGLYIVKTVTEAMEGTVEVDSTCGIGTRFTMRLPAK